MTQTVDTTMISAAIDHVVEMLNLTPIEGANDEERLIVRGMLIQAFCQGYRAAIANEVPFA